MASSAGGEPGCAPGHRVVGLRQADGMPPNPSMQDPRARRGWRQKHLTENQMLGSRQGACLSPRSKSLRVYISWYINGHGQPWTSSDPNPKMRPDHGRRCTWSGVCIRLRIRCKSVALLFLTVKYSAVRGKRPLSVISPGSALRLTLPAHAHQAVV